jgi:mycobactin salicyl-AMP ligase
MTSSHSNQPHPPTYEGQFSTVRPAVVRARFSQDSFLSNILIQKSAVSEANIQTIPPLALEPEAALSESILAPAPASLLPVEEKVETTEVPLLTPDAPLKINIASLALEAVAEAVGVPYRAEQHSRETAEAEQDAQTLPALFEPIEENKEPPLKSIQIYRFDADASSNTEGDLAPPSAQELSKLLEPSLVSEPKLVPAGEPVPSNVHSLSQHKSQVRPIIQGANSRSAGMNTTSASKTSLSFVSLLEATAKTFPGRVALTNLDAFEGSTQPIGTMVDLACLHDRVLRMAYFLTQLRLASGSTIAIQLPNSTETSVALLAVQAAGFTPLMISVTLSQEETTHVLESSRTQAVIIPARIDGFDASQRMCEVASHLYSLRFIMAFGANPVDGVISLEDLPAAPADFKLSTYTATQSTSAPLIQTYDRLAGDFVLRPLEDLMGAALSLTHLIRVQPGHRIVQTLAPDDLAGLVTGSALSQISGASLQTITVFDSTVLEKALEDRQKLHLVVPAWLETPLIEAGVLDLPWVMSVVFVHTLPWHKPEALLAQKNVLDEKARQKIIDVVNLNETALFMAPRLKIEKQGFNLAQVVPPFSTGGHFIEAQVNTPEVITQDALLDTPSTQHSISGVLELRGRGMSLRRYRNAATLAYAMQALPQNWCKTSVTAHMQDSFIVGLN